MKKKDILLIDCLIVVLGSLLFFFGIGSVRLFDWDEINFAESAREMLVTGDWFNVQINFKSFWEKPPLFIWAQALSMKVFGIGEFAARFPNALMGVITLLTLFHCGLKSEDKRFSLLWAGFYLVSFLPFFFFKSGIIDPWFNYFIFLGIYFFSKYSDDRQTKFAALSGLFTGLAVLTKGPVGFLIFALTFAVWLIVRKFKLDFRWKDVAVYLVMLALAGGAWFLALVLTGHGEVIKDFFEYQVRLFETQDAGHGGFLLYHFVILLFGVTPASFIALSTFRRKALADEPDSPNKGLFRWMMCSFWVVLILFTIVRTKIVHYSSFCYFPLTYLAAWAASRMMDGKLKFRGWQKGLLIGTAAFYGIAFTGLTLFDRFKDRLALLVEDPFAVSCMDAESSWTGFEPFVGVFLLGMTIWFCVWFSRRKSLKSCLPIVVGHLVFGMTFLVCAVGEVEKYSQASTVDFYVERQGEDCYVQPVYFKSYAQYFYTHRQPQNSCDDLEFLMNGPIDKPCYFVVKDIPADVEQLGKDCPGATFLERRPGFRFFVRQPSLESVNDDVE